MSLWLALKIRLAPTCAHTISSLGYLPGTQSHVTMAPATTAATNGAPAAAVAGHQRRSTKTHIVPVLPLPLDRKHREQRQQREMRAAQAAVAHSQANAAQANARPRDTPSTDTNGHPETNNKKPDNSPRRGVLTVVDTNINETEPAIREHHPTGRQVPLSAAMPRQPLSANHYTNTLGAAPPPPPPPSATFTSFVPPRHMPDTHSRGKENIPPSSNGIMMTPQPHFHPPPHQLHHHHPSETSIMFGGFQDSNNTSPGPLSSGMYPPPGIPINEHTRAANGHPYGWQQPELFNDGGHVYPPAIVPNVAPSPSHSFHGSQTSNAADGGLGREDAGHAHMSAASMMNNGIANRHHLANINGALPVMPPTSTHPTPPRFISQIHQHEIQKYFEFNFNNPEAADCQLTIRFSNGPEHKPWRVPVQLFGHRFILSISPALRVHLRQTSADRDVSVIFNDPYLRTDVMWDCLASLYGRPLSDLPEGDFARASGLLAAGCALQLSSIVQKGVEDTIQCIQHWETLERAVELVFHNTAEFADNSSYSQPSHEIRYRHGPASHALMEYIVEWIIRHIPVVYIFDGSFCPPSYSRLPNMEAPLGRGAAPEQPASPTVQAPAKEKNPMLKLMKFGDLPLASAQANPEGNGHSPVSSAPSGSPEQANTIISCILVNLPFAVLRDIMEFTVAGNATSLMTTSLRHKVFSQIIEERENRRLEVLAAIQAGKWGDASIKSRLGSDGQDSGSQRWDVLGWKETYVFKDGVSKICRNWQPVLFH